MSMVLYLTGIASSLCGLVFLYLAWKSAPKPVFVLAGWIALTLSSVLWFYANADRGIAQGIVVWMMVVSILLCLPLLRGMRDMHDKTNVKVRTKRTPMAGRPVIDALQNIWTFLLSGPVAGVIAIFLGGALFKILRPTDGNPATAAVTTIIVSVFLWALISVLLLIEPRPLRRSIYAGVSALAATALAFL